MTHTYEARAATRDLLLTLVDAETSQRGYLLTGQNSYLGPFATAAGQAAFRVEDLRQLTTDNPVQRRNVERIKALVDAKLAELRRTIDLRDTQGPDAALEVVRIDRGKLLMDQIRAVASTLIDEENRLLEARIRAESRTSLQVNIAFVSAIAVTFALLIWTSRLLKDYAYRRDLAEQALQHQIRKTDTLNRELERRVEERTAELRELNEDLARSNEDLERFAFVASHDLQEPLRMITTYAQLLIKTYPSQLESDAAMFVSHIVNGARRMRELLADLLTYTEIGGQSDQAREAVDLNLVVENVKQNLKASIDESGAVITSDRLPALSAYEGHFIPLFQNLIGNAIKYRSERPPRIHISVQNGNRDLRFAVADNGIGVAPEYHEKIFAVFKRLHGKKIPGTGIGLSICQRVVERYDGRIWVESEAGRGATFIFTLPKTLCLSKKVE